MSAFCLLISLSMIFCPDCGCEWQPSLGLQAKNFPAQMLYPEQWDLCEPRTQLRKVVSMPGLVALIISAKLASCLQATIFQPFSSQLKPPQH
ncbi:hypothetical protein BU24DRAFT_425717 [Aaosphaeria arxii CBS 175.79]|uniref:Secreted protein n=1 Tax=Aaosphaeria arxii CBS 175.79 TaxID=1450172 RepID=A0A6A5XGC7_9PLEO|nr:uncharacterized protein BU24DRAFT_425717 [Aaosphaeria arxii CBS 175.79]KAF2011887.1 hypothetical protein BU24DRAFT_425717 [Aaosphaeria arxii CBS 175.79]